MLAAKRLLVVSSLVVALTGRVFSAVPSVPDYEVGDIASEGIVTPVQLIVLDPEATEKLRQQEAARVPAIFRHYPDAVDEAEASLRSTFAATREKFLTSLEAAFRRRQLGSTAVANARFARLIGSFQRQNKSFPLTTNLAQVWAKGEEDEPIVAPLVSKLRETMGRTIRADALAQEGKVGPNRVLMVVVRAADGPVDLETVAKRGAPFFRTNIFQLWRVRKELQSAFPSEEQATAKFLAGFVKPNCVFDDELTRQSRAKRTDAIWAADRYEPGQSIVTNGQVVDARIKAALDQLKAKTTVEEIKAQAAEERLKAQTTVAQLREQASRAREMANQIRQRNQWPLVGLILAAFALVLWRLLRVKAPPATRLPARIPNDLTPLALQGGAVISCPRCTETIVVPLTQAQLASQLPQTNDSWRHRALLAEQRASQASALIRKSLMPQLARWLMTKVVRSLIRQRTQLVDVQRAAELEVAELERRLASVNAPLEDRLKAYERRIAELENELAAKTRENQELIRAQIDLTRRKLESERSKGPLAWN